MILGQSKGTQQVIPGEMRKGTASKVLYFDAKAARRLRNLTKLMKHEQRSGAHRNIGSFL